MSLKEHIKTHNKAYSLGFLAVVAAVVGFLFIQVDDLSMTQEMTGALIKPTQLKTQIAPIPSLNPSLIKYKPIPDCPTERVVTVILPQGQISLVKMPCPSGQVWIGPDANGDFKCQLPNAACASGQTVNCKDNTCT